MDQLRLHRKAPLTAALQQVVRTPPNRLLANGTHHIEMRRLRDDNVHVCEDTRDSRRKDKLVTCSRVMIVVYDRLYHM